MLPLVPNGVIAADGEPRFGTYRGELPGVAFDGLSGEYRVSPWMWRFRRKRWQYNLAVTRDLILAQAVVDGRYFSQAFCYAVDLWEERRVGSVSFVGVPDAQGQVNDHPAGQHHSRFTAPGASLATSRGPFRAPFQWRTDVSRWHLLRPGGLHVDAEIGTADVAPALTVVSPVEGGRMNVTQKWAALPLSGEARIGTRTYPLDGGLAGLDYTQGLLARRTTWRWAMALGHLHDGRPLGINLVEGFNDDHPTANENALWVGDRLIPLARARFEFDRDEPTRRWEVETTDGALRLWFTPFYVHDESHHLGVIRSHFLQPAGRFEGVLTLDGERYRLVLHGVMEDQDVFW